MGQHGHHHESWCCMNFTWTEWLKALYHSGEVCLVDYAKDQQWEGRILEEHSKLSEDLEHMTENHEYLISLMEDFPQYTAQEEKMVESLTRLTQRLDLLFSCLTFCYPQCEKCQGDPASCDYSGGPGDYHTIRICAHCYQGLNVRDGAL